MILPIRMCSYNNVRLLVTKSLTIKHAVGRIIHANVYYSTKRVKGYRPYAFELTNRTETVVHERNCPEMHTFAFRHEPAENQVGPRFSSIRRDETNTLVAPTR